MMKAFESIKKLGELDEIKEHATQDLGRAFRRIVCLTEMEPLQKNLTPERAARAWIDELLAGYGRNPREILRSAKFQGAEYGEGMVVVKNNPVISICEHHLLPFVGVAHFGYIPRAGWIVGLSKIPRMINAFSRRLQTQEQLGHQICGAFMEAVEPQGCGVLIECEHFCMFARGVQAVGTKTKTCEIQGVFSKPNVKEEFFQHVYGRS